jgi:SAM-dependent methyltransferase
MSRTKLKPYLHLLYEAAVQGVESDLYFASRVFKKKTGRRPVTVREDFCGTAHLACEWVKCTKGNRAWGVDLDQPTLDFGQEHNVLPLGKLAENVQLIHGDVCTAQTPKVDVLFALNFSFCLFKRRETLRAYFENALKQLDQNGLLIMDIYGGTEAIEEKLEEKIVAGFTAPDGTEIPDFTYTWDQAKYNVVTNECLNYIHFEVPGFGTVKKAFTYDWRLWTIAELRELLAEAGFSDSEVYIHGFNENGESDESWRIRKTYENALGWIAYVVGIR